MTQPVLSSFLEDAPFGGVKEAQNLVSCIYETKVAGHCHMVTVTWCKNTSGQGLSVSLDDPSDHSECKIDLKPWYFWKRHGSKSFEIKGAKVKGTKVQVCWDLSSAKFAYGPEPQEGYYVAVVCEEEVILLLGDMRKEAFKKTKARPSSIEASLISRKEHVFGKRYFTTRTRFDNNNCSAHDISIECLTNEPRDPEMSIRIDGQIVVNVKHLVWKFRGHQTLNVSGNPVQVFWDVHDWLFVPGLGHALFIFTPGCEPPPPPEISAARDSTSSGSMKFIIAARDSTSDGSRRFVACDNAEDKNAFDPSGYSLILYAWKMD